MRFLIARIHKGPVTAAGAQFRIVHRGAFRISLKSVQEPWVGLELRRSSVKPPHVAESHFRPAMHRVHHSADIYVRCAVLVEFAHIAAVPPEAHNREAAFRIRCLGRAYIHESRSVWKLHDFIDMRCNADVFIVIIRSLRHGHTGFEVSCKGYPGHRIRISANRRMKPCFRGLSWSLRRSRPQRKMS